jgi:3-deoxy-manno-octulosonate cytidylyltransferase (CMP-KDO synthetase)
MNIVAIIPARYASTRFPGKPLIDIGGKTMIQRVVERVRQCTSVSSILVATDDERIYSHVLELGAKCIMTSAHHPSGTDRCLEAWQLSGIKADAIINVQGDEPFVDPTQIDQLAQLISKDNVQIATLAKKITAVEMLFDPSKVKMVMNDDGAAMYFSRQAIPYNKSNAPEQWLEHHAYYKHIGLYAYKSAALKSICALPPSTLEMAESLEQLRWLQAGYSIEVGITEIETPAIDTPDDLLNVLREHI